MKLKTSFATRCLALVLALMLLVSATDLGLTLPVSASADDTLTVYENNIVADSYALTDAEKAIIKSGMLKSGSQNFSVPTDKDGLINVDIENSTVTVLDYNDTVSKKLWTPVSAKLVWGDGANDSEDLTLDENGKDTYEYDGAAFSVEVVYEVETSVDTALQADMLRASKFLKDGLKELRSISGNSGSLSSYQQASEYLVELADGKNVGKNPLTGADVILQFESQAAKDSAKFLDEQIKANSGKLELVSMANAYEEPYTKYLAANGIALEAKTVDTYAHIQNVMNDTLFADILSNPESTLSKALYEYDKTMYNAVTDLFIDSMDAWLFNMEDIVAAGTWPYDQDASFLKDDIDYATLDTLVGKVGSTTSVTPVETLTAASVTVKELMSMHDVTVKVEWFTVDPETNEVTLNDVQTADAIAMAEGSAKADILAKIEAVGFEKSVVTGWTALFTEFATHYEASYSDLPNTLVEETEYVITYSPKKYTVTGGAVDGNYNYGHTITLPKYEGDGDQDYDYTVNGKYVAEGSKVVVEGPMEITREVGAPRDNTTLLEYVLQDTTLTEDEINILNAAAVNAGDAVISIRHPSDALVTLDEATGVVTAEKALADYPDDDTIYWIPTVAEVAIGDTVKKYDMVEGADNYTVTITENNYDKVTVIYTLTLEDHDAGDLKNLPNVLVAETKDQLDKVGQLVAEMGSLEAVPYDILEMLKKYAEGETLTQLENILTNCYKTDKTKLDLYHSLVAYSGKANDAEKMTYYYQNQQTMEAQLKILVAALKVIKDDEAFKATCVEKLGTQASDAFNKITGVEDKIEKITLPPVNAAIDVNNAAVLTLAEELVAADVDVKAHDSADLVIEKGIVKEASGKVTVTVNMTHGSIKKSFSLTFNEGQAPDAASFNAKYNEAFAALNIAAGTEKHYTDNTAATEAIRTKVFETSETFDLEWKPIEYTVEVDGVNYGKITINNKSITLPVHEENGFVWKYTVNEKAYEQGSVVNVWDAYHAENLTITRVALDQKAERFEQFKDSMSEVSASSEALEMVFSDQDNTLTMELDIEAEQSEIMDGVTAFVMELTNLPYYIYLNGEPLYDGKVYLQTLINALLKDENFNNADFADALRNDEAIITGEMDLQPKVQAETFALRAVPNTDKTLKFEIKKVGTKDALAKAADAIEAIKPYVAFQADNGVLDVNVTLPEKVYEVYLTALIGIGEVDLNDVNAVNTEIATMFLYDYVEDILKDDTITATTWHNTLKYLDDEVGDRLPDVDLEKYEERYQQLRTVFNDWAEVTVDGGIPQIALEAPAKTVIDSALSAANVSVPSGFLDQIFEYDNNGELKANINVTLTNTNVDFEAVVADEDVLKASAKELVGDAKDVKNGAASAKAVAKGTLKSWIKGEGLANGIDYTTDLSKRLSETTGGAVVVLLKDVTDTLTFNGTTVLDLNGKTVANVQANGHLYIFDSKLANGQGGVSGTVSGNVSITAGKYTNDVSAFLPDGYKCENVNGAYVVSNELYKIVENGNELVFEINSDILPNNDIDSYTAFAKAVGAEIALDVVMNSYPYAMLYVGGDKLNKIYDFDYDDYMGLLVNAGTAGNAVNTLLDCTSLPGLAAFINEVSADLLDFAAIEEALTTDGVVASYNTKTAPWTVVIGHNASLDCITGGIVADTDKVSERKLTLQFVGNNKTEAADFFGFLDDIVTTAKFELVDVQEVEFKDKFFNVEGGVEVVLDADLSDYTTYMAVIVANALDDNTAMVKAVNDKNTEALKAEFDKLTVKNIADAIQVLNRGDDFAKLAADAGINGNFDLTGKKAYLEKAMMWTLSAAGRALQELEDAADKVTADRVDNAIDKIESKVEGVADKLGNAKVDSVINKAESKLNGIGTKVEGAVDKIESTVEKVYTKTLGGLDEDGDGVYGFDAAYSRFADVDWKGYGVNFNLTTASADVKVKLFELVEDDCLWGDANHDNIVNTVDASLIEEYVVNEGKMDVFFCTKRTDVNGDGKINTVDASLICQYVVDDEMTSFPAENQ